jgi:hypothetical protein
MFTLTDSLIKHYMGDGWSLCHMELLAKGKLMAIHASGPDHDIRAYSPSAMNHPAAFAAAVLMTWQAQYDADVSGYLDAYEPGDDDEAPEMAASGLRQFDA